MKALLLFCALLSVALFALAADDEAALKDAMHKACAPLFAPGGVCADLAKGTRNCTRQNLDKGGAACTVFEKQHKAFFEAGAKDPIVRK